MNGRIYDPQLGRFLSADIQVEFPRSLQSYNRYTYVFNNPLKYQDPSGYGINGMDSAVEGLGLKANTGPPIDWKATGADAADFVTDYRFLSDCWTLLTTKAPQGSTLTYAASEKGMAFVGLGAGVIDFGLNFISGGGKKAVTKPVKDFAVDLTENFLERKLRAQSVDAIEKLTRNEVKEHLIDTTQDAVGAATTKLNNPIPSNNEYAKVLKPEQIADIEAGKNPLLSTFPGADDAFATSSGAIPSGLTRSQAAKFLTIPEENVGGLIRFQIPSSNGVATPYNRFEIPGFVNGGRTQGKMVEFTVPNKNVNDFEFSLEIY